MALPCPVQRATAAAAPYSRSSGWATTQSARDHVSSTGSISRCSQPERGVADGGERLFRADELHVGRPLAPGEVEQDLERRALELGRRRPLVDGDALAAGANQIE